MITNRNIKSILFQVVIIFSLSSTNIISQEYFQQKVDYDIRAKLDTINKTLDADCLLSYTNNSSEPLDILYIHLWWNALSTKESAYADQLLDNRQYDYHFARTEEMGGYKTIEFREDGALLDYNNYIKNSKEHYDIVKLHLKSPINPGETREIGINYQLQIPKAFSRFGYADRLYSMTQWFPKPAVYDLEGWHPMPYLEYGEFYSEYGDYNVELELPLTFSVVGTGIAEGNITDIENNRRIIKMTADNVHDFAWFGSSDYYPYQETLYLEEKDIKIHLLLKEDNTAYDDIFRHAKRSLKYFSEEISTYPYPQLSIVETECCNGMEYPMVMKNAEMDNSIERDLLIAHEAAHNWFYSLIGSDERTYPWMDEGFVHFYEGKYKNHFYSKHQLLENEIDYDYKGQEYTDSKNYLINLQRTNARFNINRPSGDRDMNTYFFSAYDKMSWSLEYLENYLGGEVFDDCVKLYIERWSNKHPNPKDLQDAFEEVSRKDLDWYFDTTLNDDGILDYELKKLKIKNGDRYVSIKNKGSLSIPIALTSYNDNTRLVSEQWIDAIESGEEQEVLIDDKSVAHLVLNGEVPFLDNQRKNNIVSFSALKSDVLKNPRLLKNEHSNQKLIDFFPIPLYNRYDGVMLGLHLSSNVYPQENYRWYLAPHYALSSNMLTGMFSIEKDFVPKSKKNQFWTFGLDGKRFSEREFEIDSLEFRFDYFKVMPRLSYVFNNTYRSQNRLEYRAHFLNNEFLNTNAEDGSFIIDNTNSLIHQLNFTSFWNRRLSENSLLVQLEYENYNVPLISDFKEQYLKLSLTYEKKVHYNPKARFHLRFFGGYFLVNSRRESASYATALSKGSLALSMQGFADHTYEDGYFERNANDGIFKHQVAIAEGGFKTAFGAGFRTGMSNDYLLSSNLKIELPINIMETYPLRPYLDLAYSHRKDVSVDPLEGNFFYSGGLAIEIADVLGIYIPLVNSDNIVTSYSSTKIWERISLSLNLQPFNLWRQNESLF